MRARPITPRLGSEVDLDLTAELVPDTVRELRALLLDRAVLVFPAQHGLTRSRHLAFARAFGVLERYGNGEAAELDLVRIVHDAETPPTENIWHVDRSFAPAPPSGAVLRAVQVPDAGGDTVFADMRAVWQRLPGSVREVVWGLTATHDIAKWIPDDRALPLRAAAPPWSHPLVCAHPETGVPVLNVNPAYTTAIDDLPATESSSLLHYLFAQIAVPEVQCRIRWAADTVVMWDNGAVAHYAVGDYMPARRVMERVAIAGRAVRAAERPAMVG